MGRLSSVPAYVRQLDKATWSTPPLIRQLWLRGMLDLAVYVDRKLNSLLGW